MTLERIDASHPLFDASFALYEASFPPNERRLRADHLRALQDADFFPLAAVENGMLLADVFLWETDEFVYLEHFAVQPELRGHGCGSGLLRQLLRADKPLILEIEPPVDTITCRRRQFYERSGLQTQPFDHVQLPFQGGGPIVPLVIMADRALTAPQCRAFQKYLLDRVVRYTQYRKPLDRSDIIDI